MSAEHDWSGRIISSKNTDGTTVTCSACGLSKVMHDYLVKNYPDFGSSCRPDSSKLTKE